jgi:hypothetical protein
LARAIGRSRSSIGRGGGVRNKHTRGSNLKLAKEGVRPSLLLVVASLLLLRHLSSNLIEIVVG